MLWTSIYYPSLVQKIFCWKSIVEEYLKKNTQEISCWPTINRESTRPIDWAVRTWSVEQWKGAGPGSDHWQCLLSLLYYRKPGKAKSIFSPRTKSSIVLWTFTHKYSRLRRVKQIPQKCGVKCVATISNLIDKIHLPTSRGPSDRGYLKIRTGIP